MSKDIFQIEDILTAINKILPYQTSLKVLMNPIDKQNIMYGINQIDSCEILCRADIPKGKFYVVRSEEYD